MEPSIKNVIPSRVKGLNALSPVGLITMFGRMTNPSRKKNNPVRKKYDIFFVSDITPLIKG